MAKFYAVRSGRKTGIFGSWEECQKQVLEFSGAAYKSFKTREEAEAYLNAGGGEKGGDSGGTVRGGAEAFLRDDLPEVYAFTDGSFHAKERIYGYGGFLHCPDAEDIPIRGHGNDADYVESRNVAGEVLGAIAAMKKAIELGITEMTLFYDYEGVEKWALGLWKANKPISQMYAREFSGIAKRLRVHFVHVKAHTGIPGNEQADAMAKEEAGL